MKVTSVNKLITAALLILSACQSTDHDKNDKLERQLDSVNQELELTRQALMDSEQVKALLDSIDASRKITNSSVGNRNDGKNSIARLNDINEYVKDINLKIDQMEKSIRYVNTMAASIIKLQADIDMRTQKIAKLEAEAKKQPVPGGQVSQVIQHKDSTLAAFVKNCQEDIAVLQKTMEEIHVKNNLATADLYYVQAETLISIAQNVNTSSRRKLVKREALEMYKISYSLGKKEAQRKISTLEQEL